MKTRFEVGASEGELDYIAVHMRREDREEFWAWGAETSDAVDAIRACEFKWVVYRDDDPVFVFGLKQVRSGVCQVAGFGTDMMTPSIIRALTHWGKREWMPFVFYQLNIRRLEVVIPEQSEHSLKWLTRGGMRVEGRMIDYAKRGDRFLSLAYTITDFENVHV